MSAQPLTLTSISVFTYNVNKCGRITYTVNMKIGDVEVFSVAEAAERLGVAPVTLRLQITKGVLPALKVGKQYVVTAEALAAYDAYRKGPRGFARDDHPYHGKRGGGGRPRKTGPESGEGASDG